MKKNKINRAVLFALPLTFFLFFISVSFAIDIHATVRVIPKEMEIKISQPVNTTYYIMGDSKNFLLMFLVGNEPWRPMRTNYWLGYSIDDSPITPINPNTFQGKLELKYYTKFIDNIPPGSHKLTIYDRDTQGNEGAFSVYFTIKKVFCKNPLLFEMFGICL